MNPQQPPMQQPFQMPGGGVGGSPLNTSQIMQMQGESPQQMGAATGKPGKKGVSMPSRPFNASDHHIYNTLRNSLMELVKSGVPGIENVLTALNNSHVDGMKTQAQQTPTMPQQQSQIPPQVLAQLMGSQGGGQMGMPQQPQMTPTMPQGQGGQ